MMCPLVKIPNQRPHHDIFFLSFLEFLMAFLTGFTVFLTSEVLTHSWLCSHIHIVYFSITFRDFLCNLMSTTFPCMYPCINLMLKWKFKLSRLACNIMLDILFLSLGLPPKLLLSSSMPILSYWAEFFVPSTVLLYLWQHFCQSLLIAVHTRTI